MNGPSPSIAVGIVAHEKRLEHAERLASLVKADLVMVDVKPYIGCDANHRRTWHALTALNTEWLVVLEDDAIPVPGFRQQLEQALSVAPTDIVSLYLGRQKPSFWQEPIAKTTQQADTIGAHWITSPTAIHAVALAIRANLNTQHHKRNLERPPDEALTRWANQQGHQTAYTWPSLVDHADLPTTIRQHRDGQPRPPGRTAWRTGTRTTWNNNTIHMPHPLKQRTKTKA